MPSFRPHSSGYFNKDISSTKGYSALDAYSLDIRRIPNKSIYEEACFPKFIIPPLTGEYSMIVLRMEAPFTPLSPGNATHRIRHLSLQLAQDFNKFDQKSKTRKAIYDFREKRMKC